MSAGLFRRRPTTIEAMRWDPNGRVDEITGVIGWLMSHDVDFRVGAQDHSLLLGGNLHAEFLVVRPGDWICHGTDWWACDPEIFAASYETVNGEAIR